jgi:hypothetical protein
MAPGIKGSARSYLRVHGLNKEAMDHIITGDWEHPALWKRGTELCKHIDVPMQLIFFGILRTCVQMVHGWMTKRHKSAFFSRYTKNSLECIQKLNMSWCKCIIYESGNFGGWVSENYLSLGRLLPWFMVPLITLQWIPNMKHQLHHKSNGQSKTIIHGCQSEV